MSIHFQLIALAPKGSRQGKGKATAAAMMETLVINLCLSLDRDHIQGFILEHICGVIQTSNAWGVKDERAWDLFHDIMFLDPVTTRNFSQLQLMWPQHRSRCSAFREWWVVLLSHMSQMLDQTCDQMTIRWWDNHCSFGDQVHHSNPQGTDGMTGRG